MKIKSLVLFLGITSLSFAQMTEGKINYSMDFTSDNPDMAMYTGMMQGSKMVLSFIPGKSKAEISMGTVGTMTTFSDEKADKSLMLMNMMGQKMAIEGKISEATKAAEGKVPEYKVEITTETKEIAGYNCTKAIMTSESDEMIVWFTKDIAAATSGQQYYNSQMPGFPMEYGMMQQGMNVKFTVTSIDKSVDKKAFEMKIPEGYQKKTMEELQGMGQ